MGIPELFIHWIKGCISTASFSVSVNGELEGYFTSTIGLRQGCSLSPILFVIAINVLTHQLNKAAREQRFGFHPNCKEVNLTHLSFTDDFDHFYGWCSCFFNWYHKYFARVWARVGACHKHEQVYSIYGWENASWPSRKSYNSRHSHWSASH